MRKVNCGRIPRSRLSVTLFAGVPTEYAAYRSRSRTVSNGLERTWADMAGSSMVISIDSSGIDGSWKRRLSGFVTAIEREQAGGCGEGASQCSLFMGCKTSREGALAEPEMPHVAANTVHLFEPTHASDQRSFSGPNSRYAYWARRKKKKETGADGARGGSLGNAS